MKNSPITKNASIALALLAGFLYRLCISMQGIDHVDLGFSNTFYQNIFTHPEVMPFHFNYYLTGLVGGCWYHFLGFTGLLGFRLLEALTLTASVFFVYKAFERQLVNTRWAVIAILVSFLFPSIVTTFHYHTLTFFFLSLAVWCYANSLYGRQLPWTMLTGVMLGLCFFVRTGNIALILLILVPVIYGLTSHQRSLAWRLGGTMFAGMLIAVIAVVALMAALGHLTFFFTGLGEAMGYFSQEGMVNSIGNLFAVYYKDYINIILQLLAIVGLGALYIQSSRMTKRWATGLGIFLIVASVVLIATSQPYLSALSLYTLLCAPIFYSITPKEDKLLTAFVLLATYTFPFGSSLGIAGVYHWTAAMLIIPSALGVYNTSKILRRGVFICSIYIACVMLWKALSFAYGEQQPRWECTKQVGNSLLNTYTASDKANDYRHILTAVSKHTADNKWLLIGNQASELYYATETLPYLGTTQIDIYKGESLLQQLQCQYEKYGQKPVVALLKKPAFVSEESEQLAAELRQWMTQHTYQVVQDDDCLTVYK